MASVGYATLQVIPSMRGVQGRIEKDLGGSGVGEKAGRSIGSRMSSGIGKTLKTGAKITGVAIAAVLGTALVKGFGRLTAIENAEAKLRGLGHTSAGVEKIMTNALAAVKGTAFGLDEAATVAAGAVASGVKPGKDLQRTLGLVADAATIGGTSMSEMGAIFNKVAASGKVQGDVIAQLGDKGIPILQLLGKQIGKTPAEVAKLASEGKIGFDTFRKAMEEGLGGAALKSGETTQGAFKNMMAALSRFGAGLLKGVFPIAKQVFGGITKFLDGLGEKIGPVVDRVSQGLQGLFDLFIKGDFTTAFRKAFNVEEDSPIVGFLFDVREGIKGTFDLLVKGDFTGNFARAFNVGEDSKLVDFLLDARDAVTNLGDTFRRIASSGVATSSLATVSDIFTRLRDAAVKLAPSVLDIGASLSKASAQVGISTWQLLLTTVDLLSQVAVAVLVPAMQKLATFMKNNQVAVTVAVGAFTAYKVAMIGVRTVTAVTAAITGAYRAVTVGMTAASYGAAGATYAQGAALRVYQVITKTTLIATKLWTAAQWLLNAAMRANPIGIVITALVALGAGLVLAYKKSETFRAIVDGAFRAVKAVASSVVGWFTGSVVPFFTKTLPNAFNAVRSWVARNWPWILGALTGPIGLAVVAITKHWDRIKGAFSAALSWVRGVFVKVWSSAMSAITAVVSRAVDSVKRVISGLSAIAGKVRGYFNSARSAAADALDRLIGVVRGVPGRVTGALGNLGSLLYSKGREIIQGLIDGVLSMVGAIGSAIGKVTGAISKFLPGSPVKEGPLRVLNNGYAGKQIVRMVADGITGQRGLVQAAMAGATAFPVASASVPAARVSGGGLMGALQSAGARTAPMVSIGTMNTTDPKAAIREMERRASDAVALENLRGVK